MEPFPRGSTFPTLDKFYSRVFQRYRDQRAISNGSLTITYEELDRQTAKLANVFRSLGLGTDDFVGVLMENRIEYLVAQIAAARAGVIVVPLNDQLSEAELKDVLSDAPLQTLIVGSDRFETAHSLQRTGFNFNYLIGVGEEEIPIGFHDYADLLSKADATAPTVDQSPDDVAAVYYTGGTTGDPKGAMHTHAGILLNIYNHIYELDINRRERMLLVTPLGHSAGFFARAALAQGGQVVLQSSFDPERILQPLEELAISWMYLIPTMIAELLDSVERSNSEIDTLETIAYGSAPISSSRLEEGLEQFGDVFIQFYGLAEVPNLVTVLPKEEHNPENEGALESAGRPATLADVTIFDDETRWGGEIGEIGIRAPYEMKGYLNRDGRLSEQTWIKTGDIGRIDDQGRLFVLDRIQDLIIVDGEPVFSTAIEDTIQRHPQVRQVAVIGIPTNQEKVSDPVNRRYVDQKIKAIVVPLGGAEISVDDIRSFCSGELADRQLPDSIDTVGQLPETPYGKIDKRLLRQPYW